MDLRLLTLNACLHIPGGRNRYNVRLIQTAAVLALSAAVLVPVRLGRPWLAAPLVAAAVLAAPSLGMLLGGALWLLSGGRFSERKPERAAALGRALAAGQYDAVALQEVYGTWYSAHYPRLVAALAAAEGGLSHCTRSGGPFLPSVLFDAGLAILSRHPIARSRTVTFRARAPFDWLFVNRGALLAELDLGDGRAVVLATTHLAPHPGDMARRSWLLRLLAPLLRALCAMDDAARRQGEELVAAAEEFAQGRPLVVLGDFNDAEPHAALTGRLGLRDLLGDPRPATFAANPAETLLTSPSLRGRPQALDTIYAGSGSAAVEELLTPSLSSSGIAQVSDHYGVSGVVPVEHRTRA